MTTLTIHRAGPAMTVQDLGREGYLSIGLPRGGTADRKAICESAALLGQSPDHAVIEMAGMGGVFSVSQPTRISLTGAPMRATMGDRTLAWNASHLLMPEDRLTIGPAL
ncbi:MAG: urea amidolyase, partial [Marivivens sp.]|nr:urea amidolyase [Marivivens sp.]